MVGIIKMISRPSRRSHASKDSIRAGEGALRVAPYALGSVNVISTRLLGIKPFVIGMTLAVLDKRLEPANARMIQTCRLPHEGRL